MASFQWDTYFQTELVQVDQQHFNLVQLINRFGELVTSDHLIQADLDRVYAELLDYTEYHFQEEEQLMLDECLDERHINKHVQIHRDFLTQLKEMYQVYDDPAATQACAKRLLDFLVHWLAYHILGTDQNMARQLKAIRSGCSAEEAFEQQERKSDRATEPLLNALNGLFEQVTSRNQELMRLNQSLEKKVAERTQELRALNTHLRELSLTDALTGLPNRRHAMRHFTDAWQDGSLSESPLSCMVIDVDYFKQVNDMHGHDAGDKVLCALASCLQGAVRNDDLVARLGGDEFMIICPNTDLKGAVHLAKELHHEVNRLMVSVGSGIWQGSLSVGVAEKDPSMVDFEDLIKKADEQVYVAKRAGKNCVRASLQQSGDECAATVEI